jgi:hypothetical protein
VNDVLGVDLECGGDPRLTRRTWRHLVAGALQARARCSKDCPTHSTTSHEIFIRSIHYCADAEWESDEVADKDLEIQLILLTACKDICQDKWHMPCQALTTQ